MINEYKSIASVGEAEADRIRVSRATISMNEYYRNGTLISQPRINGNFVNRITRDLDPKATFDLEFFVANMKYRVDKDGIEVEPKVLEVQAVVPQYGDKVDVMTLIATAPDTINGIENYWMKDATVRVQGDLDFSFSVEEYQVGESAFGTPSMHKRTITTNDFVITSGSVPYTDGEQEFDKQDISKAVIERRQRLENDKSKERVKQAPAPNMDDPLIGF